MFKFKPEPPEEQGQSRESSLVSFCSIKAQKQPLINNLYLSPLEKAAEELGKRAVCVLERE